MTSLNDDKFTAIANRVTFTEKTSRSMRALLEGTYIGTITTGVQANKDTGEEFVVWGWGHDRYPDINGAAPTRRDALLGLIRQHAARDESDIDAKEARATPRS